MEEKLNAARSAETEAKPDYAEPNGHRISRRGLLRKAPVAAAAALGASALIDHPAAATSGLDLGGKMAPDGSAVSAGNITTAEHATQVKFDGASSPGVVLLGNDTGFDATAAAYPAAVGGWAGTTVANGVYGYTENGAGNAVVGVNVGSGSGTGVLGTSSSGTAISGSTGSTAGGATAIIGVISSASPGGFSSAVRGQNNGTGGLGIGVYGSQAGSGWGMYATTPSGIGVNASGGSGTGVNASGATGVSAFGSAVGVSANGPTAVSGTSGSTAGSATAIIGVISSTSPGGFSSAVRGQNNGTGGNGIGVYGSQAGSGWGMYATSNSGVGVVASGGSGTGVEASGALGGQFFGGRAPINLGLAGAPGPPTSGAHGAGDVWVDSRGTQWTCTAAGTPGTFAPVQTGGLNQALFTAVSTSQYSQSNSDGSTWVDVDAVVLKSTVTPAFNSQAIISGNADLWTSTATFNQDLGIFISGGAYGAGQLVAWKESGGFAGTFSPNAAFVQTVQPLDGGTTYTIKLQWKANKAGSSKIWIGAGGGAPFSPTRLTTLLIVSS